MKSLISSMRIVADHDYDPHWDYEVVEDSPIEEEVNYIKSSLLDLLASHFGDLPFSDFSVFEVEPGSLGNVVARYVNGTYSRPVIVVDLAKHKALGDSSSQALRDTLAHELIHAIQDSLGAEDMDEDQAESLRGR